MTIGELNAYGILFPAGAGKCNVYAAENLQKYLRKTCGAELTIQQDDGPVNSPFFSIGNTRPFRENTGDFDRSVLVHDGFRIFSDADGNVYFDSLSHRGVMYAVFDFIEQELG